MRGETAVKHGFSERKHNSLLTPAARELRRQMTPQEKKLWYDFFRIYPYRILRQKIVGKYIVDFYCAQAKLAIEIDGGQHYTPEGLEKDEERTEILNLYGIEVIRYTNLQIENDFISVCADIDQAVKSRV